MAGQLSYQGGKFPIWLKKWVVLHSNALYFFKDKPKDTDVSSRLRLLCEGRENEGQGGHARGARRGKKGGWARGSASGFPRSSSHSFRSCGRARCAGARVRAGPGPVGLRRRVGEDEA